MPRNALSLLSSPVMSTQELPAEMLATQDKIKKYSLQMEEKDVAIKQLKSRLLRSEEDHFKTLEEVRIGIVFPGKFAFYSLILKE